MNRAVLFSVLIFGAIVRGAAAQAVATPDTSRPFEIVKEDVDLEIAPDGRSWSVSEVRMRPLTSQGVQALQQRTLSYAAGYQWLEVKAYTLKRDGRQLPVAANDILQGHGETSGPGFDDTRTMTVVFPNLEIGDQAVLTTTMIQQVPWFAGVAAAIQTFSQEVVVRDARFALTTRGDDAAYHIVTSGLEASPPVTLGGKTRRVWTYHNDSPRKPEPGEVFEYADLPRVEVSNLADYGKVAKIYADLFADRAEVSPEIQALADKLTAGVRDRRAQTKVIYDWVASHIEYVNIVLGAGGFQPHKAADVLKNGHGDCKDHVMLLQALLAAKGIKSSAVLIRAGIDQFKLPEAPSPFLFDHLISFVPEFKLYLDSTARYAAFGVLPVSDSGKTVVIVQSGAVATTPPDTVHSTLAADSSVTLNADGSADGDVRIHATDADAISMRGIMAQLPPANDTEFFRGVLGPGSDGKFDRGSLDMQDPAYDYSAHFHQGHVASFSGPGAISPFLGYRPFSFSSLFAADLPPERSRNYACLSGTYRNTINLKLPAGVTVSSLPQSRNFTAEGVKLTVAYRQPDPATIQAEAELELNRAGPVCSAVDYARIRPVLSDMLDAMQAQILYRRDTAK